MAEEAPRPPSPTLLVKLLKMTTSSSDAEALVAMRKANAEAAKFGGWDTVMAGKITVIGDPFADLHMPKQAPKPPPRPQAPPPPPPPRYNWSAPPPPPPQWQPKPTQPKPQRRSGFTRPAPSAQPFHRRGTIAVDDLI